MQWLIKGLTLTFIVFMVGWSLLYIDWQNDYSVISKKELYDIHSTPLATFTPTFTPNPSSAKSVSSIMPSSTITSTLSTYTATSTTPTSTATPTPLSQKIPASPPATPGPFPSSEKTIASELLSNVWATRSNITFSNDTSIPLNKYGFPKVIHMSYKSKSNIPYRVQNNIDAVIRMNPDYEFRLYDDTEMRDMVTTYAPSMLSTYDGLDRMVERVDFWRYLVLYAIGGTYIDSDVEFMKPLDQWNDVFDPSQPLHAIIGIEADISDEEERKRQGFVATVQFCQWAFSSKPGHRLFSRTLENIEAIVTKEKAGEVTLEGKWDWQIIQRTGPGIFTKTVEEFLALHQLTSKQVTSQYPVVEDVGILSVHGFGYRPGVDPIPSDYGKEVYVMHQFSGIWKF